MTAYNDKTITYDAIGLRTQKVVTGLAQVANTLHFFYDAASRPAMVDFNGTMYTYVHNLQGDIVAIVDSTGALVVEYKYDAWGRKLSVTGSLATTLGAMNPFRYRGYVWDEETGLYYLRSRYYNPTWGRFVNMDKSLGSVGALLSHSAQSYCANEPIARCDRNGLRYSSSLGFVGDNEAVTEDDIKRGRTWLYTKDDVSPSKKKDRNYGVSPTEVTEISYTEYTADGINQVTGVYIPYHLAESYLDDEQLKKNLVEGAVPGAAISIISAFLVKKPYREGCLV